MDVIRLRAWDKIKQRMIYDGFELELTFLQREAEHEPEHFIGYGDAYESRGLILMLDTGMLDDTGEHIFVSDTLIDEDDEYYVVVWHSGKFVAKNFMEPSKNLSLMERKFIKVGDIYQGDDETLIN